MTYSTGSGTYSDMMDAVLTHASTDGWTLTSADWPISKGNVRGIDWDTYTQTEDDMTEGLAGGSKTQRYIRLGLGTSGANATSRAASSVAQIPNMAYDITAWHIFSDPSLCDYIHGVYQFSNGIHADCYGHFSFGELDKQGLTYGGLSYVSTRKSRGYAVTAGNNTTAGDWNSVNRGGGLFQGLYGKSNDCSCDIEFIVDATDAPAPNGVSGWPATDTIISGGTNMWGHVNGCGDNQLDPKHAENVALNWSAWRGQSQIYSGAISLAPMMMFLINGTSVSSRMRYLGNFPNVRMVRLNNIAPGAEITYNSETWKVFPALRSTDDSILGTSYKITSGRVGFAYKKVA